MKSLRDYMNLVSLAEGGVTLPNADGTTPPGAFTGADQVALNQKMSAQAAAPGGLANIKPGLAAPLGKDGKPMKEVPLDAPAAAPATAAAPAGPASPWANDPAKDAAWKALTPEDQKWLGGADPTDKFILMRAPKKGAPAAAPAAAAAPTAPAAAPAAAPAMTAADQEDADMGAAMTANAQAATQAANGVNAAGQNVTMPDGTNPETGEKTTTTAAAPAPAAGQGASPTAPANRDAMPFGKAFADAKAKGESAFTWKGKSYAVKMADPANKTAEVAKRTGVAMNSTAGGGRGSMVPPTPPVKESAYDEVERLVGLVHYR